MTKPERNEVLFEIIDGIEYATLHADIFREAMLERDRLRAGIEQIRDASGMACTEMETCSHKGCNGSIGAHLIALGLLKLY